MASLPSWLCLRTQHALLPSSVPCRILPPFVPPPIFKVTPLQFEVWREITSKNNGGKSIWPFTKLRVEFTKSKAVCAHACLRVCVCVQCFAVRSLGWVEMAEEDLAPGKSSVAVNNCIRQLSYCKNDIRDTVGIWGEVRNRLPG